MQLNEKLASLYAHLYAAKKELESMNIGKAHDEIVAAININVSTLVETEDAPISKKTIKDDSGDFCFFHPLTNSPF